VAKILTTKGTTYEGDIVILRLGIINMLIHLNNGHKERIK